MGKTIVYYLEYVNSLVRVSMFLYLRPLVRYIAWIWVKIGQLFHGKSACSMMDRWSMWYVEWNSWMWVVYPKYECVCVLSRKLKACRWMYGIVLGWTKLKIWDSDLGYIYMIKRQVKPILVIFPKQNLVCLSLFGLVQVILINNVIRCW